MDTTVRTALHTTKAPSKRQERGRVMETREMLQRNRGMGAGKGSGPSGSRRERKIALQQDIDRLKKRLRHEENVHRALARAFTRPLGALPRLPPYLPRSTLELLAEVAVLEEEVVRLEEQVVNFRHGLYQEAIHASTSKKPADSNAVPDLYPCPSARKPAAKKSYSCSPAKERRGKENKSDSNSKQSPQKKATAIRPPGLGRQPDLQADTKGWAKQSVRFRDECSQTGAEGVDICPNRISEGTLRCLLGIFRGTGVGDTECAVAPSVSGTDDTSPADPYRIFPGFGSRDVGPYKTFLSIDDGWVGPTSPALVRKLRLLLRKLGTVDLRGLNHQEKLAFWINVYNSCMMNAFLEHGIPSTPQMIVALMQKAMINVGGHLLNAMTIEHFILRRPYQSKYAFHKVTKNDEMATTSVLGLDWPEPLVTFALSCGSWSSPAVRVYTASQVEIELETAKRDYLQAAVGISSNLAIPKLLDWYLLDFAKDVESLMDWICLQLPCGLRNDAVKCVERARRSAVAQPKNVQLLPYDFSFSE